MATETMPGTAQAPEVIPPTAPPPAAVPVNGQALTAPRPQRDRIQVHYDPTDPASLYMDTGMFEQLQRVAQMMAKSSLIPAHLRYHPSDPDKVKEQRVSDCFLVVSQAFRWRMDPFAVAQHTMVVSGKLGYEGKLIAAVINASGKTEKNLDFEYSGAGPGRTVKVIATLKGEKAPRTVEGSVDAWSTDNDMWRKDPDQILAYRGSRQWARRHAPEIMLGINADEELPAMARSVDLARTPSGGYAPRTDAPVIADPLLAAIGITAGPVPEPGLVEAVKASLDQKPPAEEAFVLVDPPKPEVTPSVSGKTRIAQKDCSHPEMPPSRIPAGKTRVCPDCLGELQGDPLPRRSKK